MQLHCQVMSNAYSNSLVFCTYHSSILLFSISIILKIMLLALSIKAYLDLGT